MLLAQGEPPVLEDEVLAALADLLGARHDAFEPVQPSVEKVDHLLAVRGAVYAETADDERFSVAHGGVGRPDEPSLPVEAHLG